MKNLFLIVCAVSTFNNQSQMIPERPIETREIDIFNREKIQEEQVKQAWNEATTLQRAAYEQYTQAQQDYERTKKPQFREEMNNQLTTIMTEGEKLQQLKTNNPEIIKEHIDATLSQLAQNYVPIAELPKEQPSLGQQLKKTFLSGVQNFLNLFSVRWDTVDRNLRQLESLENNGNLLQAAENSIAAAEGKRLSERIKQYRIALEQYRRALRDGQAPSLETIRPQLENLIQDLVSLKKEALLLPEQTPASQAARKLSEQINATLHHMGFTYQEIAEMTLLPT